MTTDITEGTLVAIPVPWESSASGCVEWRLVNWTLADDMWPACPVLSDADGEEGAWSDDYALRGPQDDEWRFPDGERCDDEGLRAAFARRQGRQ
jgi:hypothetical protein